MNSFVSPLHLLLLSVWMIGCQTAARDPKPTVIVRSPAPAQTVKQFWAAASRLFLPDSAADTKNTAPALIGNRIHSDMLPARHSAASLYQAGSIAPSQYLVSSRQTANDTKEVAAVPQSEPEKINEEISEPAAPLPDAEQIAAAKPSPKKLPRKRAAEPEYTAEEENDDEPIIAKTMLKRSGNGISAVQDAPPVYPSLTQLPGASPIQQTSYSPMNPPVASAVQNYGAGDWQSHVRAGIEQLRYAMEHTPNGASVSNEMRLRMMETLLGNKGEAAKPIASADKTLNEFLGQQVLGFAALLDESAPDNRSRYISAAYRFGEGLASLQNLCPIKFKTALFVKDWLEYGIFVPRAEEYKPGEEFIVYIEIENPTIRREAEGFNSSIAMNYEIRDASAKIVVKQDAGNPKLTTQSRKRDYCLNLRGFVPPNIPPGQYQLRISMTDLNDDAMQYAEEQIPFKVAPAIEERQ